MIRILQVLPRLRRGGSQAMVMNLYRALDRERFQFDFIIFTQDHDDYYDEIHELGGRIFHFTKFNGKNWFIVQKEWKEFLEEHPEYKILHSHVRSFASIYIPIANKYGLTTIIHSHSTSNEKSVRGVIKTVLEYPLRYQADYLFACSTAAGKWLFGEKATKGTNYKFIPNAIPISNFVFSNVDRSRIRNQFGIKDEIVVGHVGGFETPKNHVFLLDCFKEFLNYHPNAKLLLVGDGTYEKKIRNLCNDYHIMKSVIFVGLQTNVSPYLSAMDVFLFPSLWEGLPVSVVEAQVSGLRCLLSDSITRDVELTDLLTYNSLSKGAKEWAELLNELVLEERCAATEDNLNRLADFDCMKTIKELENFYSECIGS